METLSKFQQEVNNVLKQYNYTQTDIAYVNLSSKYFVNANAFVELKSLPEDVQEELIHVSWCNKWYVPQGFCIIMEDNAVFKYITTSDEYYSGWVYLQQPQPSPIELGRTM